MADRGQWVNLGLAMRGARERCRDAQGKPWSIQRLVGALEGANDRDVIAAATHSGLSLRRWRRSTLYAAESGAVPSRELVDLYEQLFGDGHSTLVMMYEQAKIAAPPRHEPSRSPTGYPIPGDASQFVCDVTVPDGIRLPPNVSFTKTWRIRNAGTVPWEDRRLRRIGASNHYSLPSSPLVVPIATTPPGELVDISVAMTTPSVPATCITYWKMVDADGKVFFPQYPQGLSCLFHVVEDLSRTPNLNIELDAPGT